MKTERASRSRAGRSGRDGDDLVAPGYAIPSFADTQVNLPADMWACTVNAGVETKGSAFGVPIG